jgi:hypothetical protein
LSDGLPDARRGTGEEFIQLVGRAEGEGVHALMMSNREGLAQGLRTPRDGSVGIWCSTERNPDRQYHLRSSLSLAGAQSA